MRYAKIKGSFSERRRIPLLGRIRLGLKVQYGIKDGVPLMRPTETDYFVVPEDVAAVIGNKPKELTVMLPSEDVDTIFPQNLSWFGKSVGLKCTGNMEEAERLNEQTGVWEKRTCPCEHYKSDDNPKGDCTESGTLVVMLPEVSMGGTYQIRTGSYHSVVDINSGLDFIRALIGRISMVPLKLRRVARITHNDNKAQTHYTLSLTMDANIKGINALRRNTPEIMESAKLIQIEGPAAIDPENDGLPADTMDDETVTPEQTANATALEEGRRALAAQQAKPAKAPAPTAPAVAPATPTPEAAKPAAPARQPVLIDLAPARSTIVSDGELNVPVRQLNQDAVGQDLLVKLLKNYAVEYDFSNGVVAVPSSNWPAPAEARLTLLEALWDGVGDQARCRKR